MAEKIRVLFLSAYPEGWTMPDLFREKEVIEYAIRSSHYRDSINFTPIYATRPEDLREALEDMCPNIVHFTGHGHPGGIFLEDGENNPYYVSNDDLKRCFEPHKDYIKLILLNSCYSIEQAKILSEIIGSVIGMKEKWEEQAGIDFPAVFYREIGKNCTIKDAFNESKTALTSCKEMPQLLPTEGKGHELKLFPSGSEASQFDPRQMINTNLERLGINKLKLLHLSYSTKKTDGRCSSTGQPLESEMRIIPRYLKKTGADCSITLEQHSNVTQDCFLKYLKEVRPEILHFTGCGKENGNPILKKDNGEEGESSIEELIDGPYNIKVALLNFDYSLHKVNHILKYIDCVIGVDKELKEEQRHGLISFISEFYASIGKNMSIQQAFDKAKLCLKDGCRDLPQLKIKPKMKADDMFILHDHIRKNIKKSTPDKYYRYEYFYNKSNIYYLNSLKELERGDICKALQKLKLALEAVYLTDPLNLDHLTLRGYIFKTMAQALAKSDTDADKDAKNKCNLEALRFFQNVVNEDPQNAGAHNGIGNINYALACDKIRYDISYASGKIDYAIESYLRAIKLVPDYSFAHHDLALAYVIKMVTKMVTDSAESEKCWKKAKKSWKKAGYKKLELEEFKDSLIKNMHP